MGPLQAVIVGPNETVLTIHPKLRPDLEQWLSERPTWPGAGTSPALFLNTRGGRLSVRAASGIIATIAENARLDDETTPKF